MICPCGSGSITIKLQLPTSKPFAALLLLCLLPVVLAACGGGDDNSNPNPPPAPIVSATNSTITAAPTTATADGSATAAITVILRDTNNQLFAGNANVVITANPCSACSLHYANNNGSITGTIGSTVAEDIALSFTVNGAASPSTATVHFVAAEQPPNIVLIIMDDVGIDQMRLFGYGGQTPAFTPSINELAQQGLKFHNMWGMPACSNGRAALFTGRYPFRTHVMTAIGSNDLANYMVNPSEMTLPDLLHQQGYKSALFGKFHLGIQSHDPYGYAMVNALGFDYFAGWLDETGDPSSIDTTAGGVAPSGTWSCGFVRDAQHGGADTGACYHPGGICQVVSKSGSEAPGRMCRDAGGIFDPAKLCQNPTPGYVNFQTLSGHYVSPLVINYPDGSVERVPASDVRARTYRDVSMVNEALDWINGLAENQPWMVVLSSATVHAPVMQPPSAILPDTQSDLSNLDCENQVDQRVLSNAMEEGLDHEIGRFLVTAGIASYDSSGQLVYNPEASNTYVILITDNGSNGAVVKVPFDPFRAKSTAYQTGVWVPSLVAGPGVTDPGRVVYATTDIVDLYQLIGNLAGLDDVHQSVPRTLDSQPLLPYLQDPAQTAIRSTSFTEIGTNLHANGEMNGPCVYSNGGVCTQIAPSAGVCHDNNGVWWGADPDEAGAPPEGFTMCCEVAVWKHDHGEQIPDIYPKHAYAMRNADYKLVVNEYDGYDSKANACAQITSTEFYQINEDIPTPKLDLESNDLLASGQPLTTEQQQNFEELSQAADDLYATQSACPADVNLDGVVNQADIDEWEKYEQLSQGLSSWADINQDGFTDSTDQSIIEQDMGACPAAPPPAKPNKKRQ